MIPCFRSGGNSPEMRTCPRRLSAKWLWLALVLSLVGPLQAARPFYDFRIVAQTGQDAVGSGYTFGSIQPKCSIHDAGQVAFITGLRIVETELGQGMFVRTGLPDGLKSSSSASDTSPNKVLDSVWINNAGKIATRSSQGGDAPRWPALIAGSWQPDLCPEHLGGSPITAA